MSLWPFEAYEDYNPKMEESTMSTKKAKSKSTKNRVSNSGPGLPVGGKDLVSNGCGAHSCGAVTHSKTGRAATDVEITAAEEAGFDIPEV